MYFVDVDVAEGEQVQKLFEDEFGHGMATFLECDVRDKRKFEGRYNHYNDKASVHKTTRLIPVYTQLTNSDNPHTSLKFKHSMSLPRLSCAWVMHVRQYVTMTSIDRAFWCYGPTC